MIILCEENDIDVVHESRLDVAVNEEVGENGPHTLDCSTAGLNEDKLASKLNPGRDWSSRVVLTFPKVDN